MSVYRASCAPGVVDALRYGISASQHILMQVSNARRFEMIVSSKLQNVLLAYSNGQMSPEES
jgi:hypothetical protein